MGEKIKEKFLTARLWCVAHHNKVKVIRKAAGGLGRFLLISLLLLLAALCVALILRLRNEVRVQEIYDGMNRYSTFA